MLRIGLFWEEAFPTVDAPPPSLEALRRALDGFDVRILGFGDLQHLPALDLLILPFGSAFPELGWPQIVVYLQAGGSLLNLGGVPFSVPCVRRHVVWKPRGLQPAFCHEVGIRHVQRLDTRAIGELRPAEDEPILAGLRDRIAPQTVFELLLGPPVHGAAGAANGQEDAAVVRPLLHGKDTSGRSVAAPIVAVDHVGGPFAGGRWVLVNMDGRLPEEAVRRLAFYGALGASDLSVSPSFACYYAGEQPRLTIHAGRFGPLQARQTARVSVTDPNGVERVCDLPPLSAGAAPAYQWTHCNADLFGTPPLPPGFYTVEATLVDQDAEALATVLRLPPAAQPAVRRHRSGFWVWDERLLKSDTATADASSSNGILYPLVGAVYPLPDPRRGSLASPNPRQWDADLRAMKETGVTMVRVGPAIDRRRAMAPGQEPDEGYLRAIDALVLTARRHGLRVLFTLFTFPPEAWDGENPYLDPHAVAAQHDFAAALVARYREAAGILWEVTDTPSLLSPEIAARIRPLGDAYETRAWQEWLAARSTEEVRRAWGVTPRASLGLPDPADFAPASAHAGSPRKAMDYRRFAQEIYERWQNELAAFTRVRLSGGGATARPGNGPAPLAQLADAPAGNADADLVWRVLLARSSQHPVLVSGAAGRLTEDLDGLPHQSEEDWRNALERTLALALVTGCAGVVIPSWSGVLTCEGELITGLLRTDDTAGPVAESLRAMAQFLSRNRHHLAGPEAGSGSMVPESLEPVVMVVPESVWLLPDGPGVPATRSCVRTFVEVSGAGLRAVSERAPGDWGHPRLLLVPSPQALRQDAWEQLLACADAGSCVLITGPVDRDEHWQPCDRWAPFGLTARREPLAPVEAISLKGEQLYLRFGGNATTRWHKAVLAGRPAEVVTLTHGAGRLLFAPLPFELAENPEPLAALYRFALSESGVTPPFTVEGAGPGIVVRSQHFLQAVLYAVVSRASDERSVQIQHGAGGARLEARVPAHRAVLILAERETGAELDRYTPQ